jgi:hypothetical protein
MKYELFKHPFLNSYAGTEEDDEKNFNEDSVPQYSIPVPSG